MSAWRGAAASRIYSIICRSSRNLTTFDRENRKNAWCLVLRREFHEIRFDYQDMAWLGLWQSVSGISFRKSVLPIVQEYMRSTKIEKHHLLNVIYKLRIKAKLGQAREICAWMINKKIFKIEESDHVVHLELLGRISKYDATRCFWEIPAELRSEASYTAILRVFARWHAVPAAEDTMSEMKSLNLITRVDPYNILMDMYKRKKEDAKLRASYDELLALGLVPDVHTFLILLRAKQELGGFDGIEHDARKFLTEQLVVKQPLFVHEAMLRTYTLLGDSEGLENLWSTLRRNYKKISTSSFNCMLDSYRQLGQVDRAERLFNDMGNRIRLQTQEYRQMIAVYTDNGCMRQAADLYKQLFRRGLDCHPAIYHSMVSGYVKVKDYENALIQYGKAWDRSVLGHPQPLRSTILLAMKVLAEQGDIKGAEALVKDLKRGRRASDVQIYNLLLKTYIKAEVPVFGFDGRMLAAGVKPDEESLELLKRINLPPKHSSSDRRRRAEAET